MQWRNHAALRYQPLVAMHAKKVHVKLPASVRLEDLVSDGQLGLLDAIDNFDPARRVKFETYAASRIRGSIIDGIRERDYLSRSMRKSGGGPGLVSMSCPLRDAAGEREMNRVDLLAAPTPAHAVLAEQRSVVREMLVALDRASRLAMELYYVDGLTMKEIGGALGLSESRVSQITSAALRVLRATMKRID